MVLPGIGSEELDGGKCPDDAVTPVRSPEYKSHDDAYSNKIPESNLPIQA